MGQFDYNRLKHKLVMIPKNDKVKTFTKQLIINYSDTLQRETIKLICYLSCTGGKRNFTKTGGKRNFF